MSKESIDPQIIEKMREPVEFRQQISDAARDLNARIRLERHKTHQRMVKTTAEKMKLKLEQFSDEGLRRNKIQRRFLDREYAKLKQQVVKQMRVDGKQSIAFEKEYHEKYLRDLVEKEGNPCLLLWEHEGGPGEHVTNDGPGGMVGYGCRPPQMSDYEHEAEVDVSDTYGARNHVFYSRNYVQTGEDDSHVWQRVRQEIIIGRRPLESGQGDFNVTSLQLWIRGIGYCEIRPGDIPCGEGVIGPTSEANLEVDLVLGQRHDDASDGYYFQHIYHRIQWSRHNEYIGEARIEPEITSIDPVIIYSPDNGGHEITLYVSISNYVGAYLEEARAELDFSRPDSEGINLHDVRLCGNYA